jgi:hypothetical protein
LQNVAARDWAGERGQSRFVDDLLFERRVAPGAGRERLAKRAQYALHVSVAGGRGDLVGGVMKA